jgi:hypothetical protein
MEGGCEVGKEQTFFYGQNFFLKKNEAIIYGVFNCKK